MPRIRLRECSGRNWVETPLSKLGSSSIQIRSIKAEGGNKVLPTKGYQMRSLVTGFLSKAFFAKRRTHPKSGSSLQARHTQTQPG